MDNRPHESTDIALGTRRIFYRHGDLDTDPDKLDEDDAKLAKFGVFGTTLVAFFLAEMGDKTQVATVALMAQYLTFFYVVAGTTLGMMIANVPAVLLGEKISQRMPVRAVHAAAAAIFAILGIATLFGAGENMGF